MQRTILVLDDDVDFLQLTSCLLQIRGHRVLRATRGAEAVRLLGDRPRVDLIVVDGLLPDTDGPTWIAQLRARGIDLPVVFVSSFWRDLASFRRLTGELGCRLVIRKPIAPVDFAERVDGLLRGLDPQN